MTKLELMKSAINHQANKQVPYAINTTREAYEMYGEQLIEEYGNDQIKEDYANGIIELSMAVPLAIGNHLIYVYAPWWDWSNLPDSFQEDDTPEELPDTIGNGSYEKFFQQVAYIREHYDVYIVATFWGSHWEKAYFSRGIENFLCDLAVSPEWAQSLLDLIIDKNMVMLQNILTCKDIDGVLLGSDWGTQKDLLMSPECFRTMIKPGEQREYDLIKKYGKDVFVHSCGNVERIMEDIVELGVDVLNPIQPECMDIKFLKETYGSNITFYGGISTQRTLPYGTPEDVIRETNEVIALMSKNGGYITAPSQEIQEDVPYANLKALIDTAKRWAEE